MEFKKGDIVVSKIDIPDEFGRSIVIRHGEKGVVVSTGGAFSPSAYIVKFPEAGDCLVSKFNIEKYAEKCANTEKKETLRKLECGSKFYVKKAFSSGDLVISEGPCSILEIKTLLDESTNHVEVCLCQNIYHGPGLFIITSKLFNKLVQKGVIEIVDNNSDKEDINVSRNETVESRKRNWTTWRNYTKTFLTEHGEYTYIFSIRSNGKRTVCRTYVTNDDNQTIKIEGVSTCNEKAGEVFSAKYGFALATIRCETALANWLSNNLQKKLTTLEDTKMSLTKQATEYAFIKASLLNGNFNMQDFDEFIKRG